MLNFDPWVQQLSLYWTSWVGRLFVASYLIRVGSVFAFFFAFSRNSDTIPSNAASLFSFNILPSHERIGQRTIKRSWPSSSKFLLFCARKKKRRVHYMIDHFFRFEVFSTHCSQLHDCDVLPNPKFWRKGGPPRPALNLTPTLPPPHNSSVIEYHDHNE